MDVGSSVESLIPDDNLYYPGTLVDCPDGNSYTVHFEDDEVHTVPRSWVKPNQRCDVLSSDLLLVTDGFINHPATELGEGAPPSPFECVTPSGAVNPKPVRLLSFKSSPLVYQSAASTPTLPHRNPRSLRG